MMKSEKLKTSAKNNTEKDFEFAYFDNIDDALIEGLEQNQDFFSLLLSNDEMKRKVLGIFSDEIYNSLKEAEQKYEFVLYLIVEESYNPDKTRLLLEFAKKQTIKINDITNDKNEGAKKEPKRSQKQAIIIKK